MTAELEPSASQINRVATMTGWYGVHEKLIVFLDKLKKPSTNSTTTCQNRLYKKEKTLTVLREIPHLLKQYIT